MLRLVRLGEATGSAEGVASAEGAENAEGAPTATARLLLEPAFVRYFRKEAWASSKGALSGSSSSHPQPLLSDSQLKLIFRWQDEHERVRTRKANLLSAARRQLGADATDASAGLAHELRTSSRAEEAEDVAKALSLQLDETRAGGGGGSDRAQQTGALRRPARKKLFSLAVGAGIEPLVEKFGLSASQVVENVCLHASQFHLPLEDTLSPLEAAQVFVATAGGEEDEGADAPPPLPAELSTPERALAAAREVLAQRLAAAPALRRAVRAHLASAALLVVDPTEKGKEEVDPQHEHHALIALCGHPAEVRQLRAGDSHDASSRKRAQQLLGALRAERQGYVSVRVYTTQPRMDGSSGISSDAMMAKLRAGFLQRAEAELATGDADAPLAAGALEWNKQRELCLVRALEGLLYPQLIAELKEQLSREAEAAVSAECAARLRAIALAPPYRPPAALEEVCAEMRPEMSRDPPNSRPPKLAPPASHMQPIRILAHMPRSPPILIAHVSSQAHSSLFSSHTRAPCPPLTIRSKRRRRRRPHRAPRRSPRAAAAVRLRSSLGVRSSRCGRPRGRAPRAASRRGTRATHASSAARSRSVALCSSRSTSTARCSTASRRTSCSPTSAVAPAAAAPRRSTSSAR